MYVCLIIMLLYDSLTGGKAAKNHHNNAGIVRGILTITHCFYSPHSVHSTLVYLELDEPSPAPWPLTPPIPDVHKHLILITIASRQQDEHITCKINFILHSEINL